LFPTAFSLEKLTPPKDVVSNLATSPAPKE
jgi:hypothetical protein